MEHLRQLLWIAAFGAVGAVCRYQLSLTVQRWAGESFPWGTLVVNLAGCFLLGLLAGLTSEGLTPTHALPPAIRNALAAGFLGALTTFSTFGFETFTRLERGQYGVAAANIAVSVVVGLLAVAFGATLARTLAS